ncbi:MAG: ribosome biogenesis GTP-binding protein YsxC, partial [Clostridia bacterium]|nr:ribosome biogenesis GTP-binding protein YsxC [Clostridia bacterium]
MAKTSSTPGRTRLVNYFNVNEECYLDDLPGYGYHKASKSIADSWDKVMNDYFVDNDKLRVVMLLLDSRILPTELDLQMLDFLATHDIPCVVILTKTDKLNRSEINNAINKVSTMIRYNKDLIIPTSATKKQGVEKIAILLDNYLS